ncbi:MAG: glucose-1-phosphate adenylyltransferase [Ignavibacteria bacterium RIFOXYB2_FULL_35_12]|nr:MAG: glucose-1-phosphate adenylyltransferase [Ignavibacteria bacterium GWC2_35_8]OGU82600.1 MAG: glucose-1-phosphate adenylyltransferase [Ignavibacteria bacterium RIFOXYA2_FULL_35_9]OGU88197.1 MAG: glucose-1-phosphate adenylyltransferase [Ignavibacteria bacterium RIFOXYC12_FULL_35_11]OGU88766.1 MAG: glucose-1-phosphate adenylyltransferase [Ignavibacteria bacterium RIFOXYA12_FULL_35_25]OGU95169.1 MAG: glucose-1-phosphate adenylyltransferase [Ignavibacteria bacterium RIFOXYB12_FULL_35_14]OGU9
MTFPGSSILRDTVTMLLAGGQGERLYPLTAHRGKPAVPFGGKYRIIDFALSNCLNSGLRKIYVLVQYKSDSLNQHIFEAWSIFNPELGEFIYSVPPQRKMNNDWYLGTANAIYQNMNLFSDNKKFNWVLLLSGDHIYKMDYLKMLQYHVDTKADLSIACIEVPREEATRFGVVSVDDNYAINSFVEKPVAPPEIPDQPGFSFVNMGIYVFNAQGLRDILIEMESKNLKAHDFGKDVLPYMVQSKMNVAAYKFYDENKKQKPYWKDIGTIESYYEASMDLISIIPEFNFYDLSWPMRTYQFQFPPAKTVSHEGERVGRTLNSLICDGSIVSGGLVERSLLGPNVKVNSFAYITDSIIMNNCKIGRHTRIRRAIIDKNVDIPEGYEIGFDLEGDKKKFTVTESGIVVVAKNQILPEK